MELLISEKNQYIIFTPDIHAGISNFHTSIPDVYADIPDVFTDIPDVFADIPDVYAKGWSEPPRIALSFPDCCPALAACFKQENPRRHRGIEGLRSPGHGDDDFFIRGRGEFL